MSEGHLRITLIGGPTALIETAGLRFLTDPTFDPPGGEYVSGPITLRKTHGPALSPDALGHVDAVLLSHDQNYDNLDHAGRAMLARSRSVITTPSGCKRLGGNAIGLEPWQSLQFPAAGGRTLRITATPARHGPPGIEAVSGAVTGFMLTVADRPDQSVYISGDTVWFEGVQEAARQYHAGILVLHMGAARIRERGPDALTMTTADGLRTAHAFPNAHIMPVHYEGWAHFTEGRDDILKTFAEAGLSARLCLLSPGQSVDEGALHP